jgi:DNA-binding NtrC family response regulator
MDKKNILIVEDEQNLARTLAQALRLGSDGNFQVDICESGEEAVPMLEDKNYDVVISDLRLPGIDGLELIAHIKRSYESTHTILMTGYGSEQVEAQADQVTEGYLTKPFDMLDLLIMVQKVIDPAPRQQGQALKRDDLVDDHTARKILIMEDDPGLRRIYSKALKKSHFEFICDIHMGRERGTDLLSQVTDKLSAAGTQVIMCSAYGQYRSLTEEMGADFFLEKPISLGTLLTLISRLTEAKKQTELKSETAYP